jgi:hypothetical protein
MVRILKGIDWMREHPEMFLALLPPQGRDLSGRLAHEALLMGAQNIQVTKSDEWWIISADSDWLDSPDVGVQEFFERVVPFPEGGRNAHRYEILLTAFATKIITKSSKGTLIVKGTESIELAPIAPGVARIIAFSLR